MYHHTSVSIRWRQLNNYCFANNINLVGGGGQQQHVTLIDKLAISMCAYRMEISSDKRKHGEHYLS